MKKIFLILGLITGFAACNNPTESPSATIDGMFTAMKSGELENMKSYITKADVARMEFLEQLVIKADPEAAKRIKEEMANTFKEKVKDVSYVLQNEKVDGNKSTVDVIFTADKKTDTLNFNLVKEEGNWKVALSKSGGDMFNSMKGNMGKEEQDFADGIEKLEKMHPDSANMIIKKGLLKLDSAMQKNKKQ